MKLTPPPLSRTRVRPRATLVLGVVLTASLALAGAANADPSTPGLATGALHASANAALAHLRSNVQTSATRGAYIAFDPSVTDMDAMAACDDDGDPVVVITEAMLRVMADVADTAVADVEAPIPPSPNDRSNGAKSPLPRVDAYASLLASSAAANGSTAVRPVSPPAGTFAANPRTNARSSILYSAMIETLVAHELAHLDRGDVRCSNPTETHESADDLWTPSEANAARSMAHATYSGERVVDADARAAGWMAGLHDPKDGATVLFTFFAAIERRNPKAAAYLTTHPHAALRLEVFRAAWERAAPTAPPPASSAVARPAHH